jgi:hypothetical protein
MEITQQEVSRILQDIDDASFHLRKYAEMSHVPQDLAARITAMSDLISVLADDMEEHFDDYGDRIIEEEDYNAGFNEIMDADIMGMLQSMRIR